MLDAGGDYNINTTGQLRQTTARGCRHAGGTGVEG
jgi:hypothetical protein